MLRKILGCLLLCVSSICAHAVVLDQIVVFGDSLSDNGNLYEYMHRQMPLSPPYYKGRFSNGPVWVELLAQKYYAHDLAAHLLDYAFGGSGVEGENDEPDDVLFTLNREVDSYLLAHQDRADADKLYVIWMGANNYLGMPEDPDLAIKDVLWGIHANMQRLISKGAKHILLMNMPNLGQLPIARDLDVVDLLTYCSNTHNALLEKNLETWRTQNPNAHLMFFDVSKDFADMIAHPSDHLMTNVTDTCYEALLDQSPSNKAVLKMVSTVRRAKSQSNACDGYMFFDPVHPSILVHQELADRVALLLAAENVVFK
jgi:phospholipase/lecithinase/hemolysin